MGQQSTVIYPEALKSIASSGISSSYQAIGAATTHQARIIKLLNNSTQDVTVSWDGINDHDYVPANSFALYDFTTNRSTDSPLIVAQTGTNLFVKGTAGTGSVYLVVFYGNTVQITPPL